MNLRSSRLAWPFAPLALALVLAACGSDSSTVSGATTTQSTLSPAFTSPAFTAVSGGGGEPGGGRGSVYIRSRVPSEQELTLVEVTDLVEVDGAQLDDTTWTQLVEGFGERDVPAHGFSYHNRSDCIGRTLLFLDPDDREVLRVLPKFCGLRLGPFIDVGSDTVVTGQNHYQDDFPAVEGAVVVNGPGQHGLPPDVSVPLVIDESLRDEPLESVCVDVTVRSGDAGPDGTVGVAVNLLEGDEVVEVPYPPASTQPPDRAVLYPLGPIPVRNWVPDTIRVQTIAGTITSWESTARPC